VYSAAISADCSYWFWYTIGKMARMKSGLSLVLVLEQGDIHVIHLGYVHSADYAQKE